MRVLVIAIAAAAGMLGAVVIAGWMLRMPALVQVFPGSSSMTLSTALLFLLGAVTLWAVSEGRGTVARASAGVVALLAAAVLLQHAAGVYLGIDLTWLQDWIADGSPTPGRTAASTGVAFLAFGAGALALVFRRGGAWFPLAAAAVALALAAVNLLGYLLRLEDLFTFLQGNRMAVHTATGLLLLGAGLFALAQEERVRDEPQVITQRIVAAAVGWLALAALVAGGTVFALMQQNLQQSTGAMLVNMLEVRQRVALAQLAQGQSEVELIVSQPALHRAIRAADAPAAMAAIQGFVGDEFGGLAVHGADGVELGRVGRFAPSVDLRYRLQGRGPGDPAAEILASGREIHLRLRTDIRAGGGVLGTLVSEQPMALLSRFMRGEGAHGATGEMALCHGGDRRLWCFPQRLNPRVFDLPSENARGTRLPMSYALEGATGFVRTRDYRGQNVLAAHGPVGDTGLGMVVKVDTAELFAPVRAQILDVLLGTLLVILLGAWLLRRRVLPLALQLNAAEADARAAHEQMQKIADSVPALIGYLDRDERYRFVNHTYERWFGQPATAVLGKTLKEVWDAERFAANWPNVLRALAGERVEFERTLKTGETVRHLRTTYVPDLDADGKARGFFVLSNDVTGQVEARRELDRTMQKLDFALDASRAAVWETDLRSGETVLSDAWAEILDRTRAETRTSTDELAALVHPDDLGRVRAEVAAVLKGEKPEYAMEHRVRAESGHWKWILSRGRVLSRDPATGEALTMMGTNLDITERKRSEIDMERMANYDGLTGAVNRNLFRDRLRRAIAQCRRTKGHAALMYLDIDKFKGINDTLGHAAGDALLREFAARLKAAVRDTDTVGRLGGDEFAVLMEDVKDAEAPGRVAQKILEAMRVPVDADGRKITVTTSIGVALFDGIADPESLAKRADEALYAAKAAGRNTYRVAA